MSPQSERRSAHQPATEHALPHTIEPMIAADEPEPFDSQSHIFELLWEGLRAAIFVDGRSVRIQDRYGREITARFPELALLHQRVHRTGTAIDGMIVALDDDGTPEFRGLLPRLLSDGSATAGNASHIAFHAFDVLYHDAESVMDYTLRRRKEILREVVRPGDCIAVPDDVQTDGIALFEAARQHRLAGIVAKELNSSYAPGARSRAWLTIRTFPRSNFVVGGFTYGGPWRGKKAAKHRGPIESVLVGLYDGEGRLHFAGEASGSFQSGDIAAATLDSITTAACPFAEPPAVETLVFWCRPQLAAAVRYADWTPAGTLRFPVFETLRPDVPPETLLIHR
jgi:bifunctional non-homologous end joining protein LigD